MSDALRLRDVSVTLGGVSVLESASLSVREGEFLGLVGPNGAGKTTLLRTVNGVLDPDGGEVLLDGKPAASLSAPERSRLVATVPQDTSVRFDLRVADLVGTGRTPYRDRLQFGSSATDRDHVDRAIERTDLTALRDRSVGAISGGERQRAYVARALAQDTPLILCDEPTASLDVNHQVAVLELLAGLVEEGRTVVAAIHDLDLAARFCDRIALLADGRISETGTPEAVLDSGLVDEAFGTATAVTTNPVTGTPTVTARGRPGDREGRVHVVGGGTTGARVLAALADAGFSVTAGPLREGDRAVETARALDVTATTIPPTGTADAGARREARERAGAADAVVLADAVLGEDGLALSVAAAGDSPVAVERRPLHERNYAGEDARREYERLRSAAVTTDAEGVVDAVETAVERPVTTSADADD